MLKLLHDRYRKKMNTQQDPVVVQRTLNEETCLSVSEGALIEGRPWRTSMGVNKSFILTFLVDTLQMHLLYIQMDFWFWGSKEKKIAKCAIEIGLLLRS